jgi:hypothetical protein
VNASRSAPYTLFKLGLLRSYHGLSRDDLGKSVLEGGGEGELSGSFVVFCYLGDD